MRCGCRAQTFEARRKYSPQPCRGRDGPNFANLWGQCTSAGGWGANQCYCGWWAGEVWRSARNGSGRKRDGKTPYPRKDFTRRKHALVPQVLRILCAVLRAVICCLHAGNAAVSRPMTPSAELEAPKPSLPVELTYGVLQDPLRGGRPPTVFVPSKCGVGCVRNESSASLPMVRSAP